MDTKDNELHIGDRVCFSAEGLAELRPRRPDRLGVVVRVPRDPELIFLRWDGTKSNSGLYYHRSFITKKPQLTRVKNDAVQVDMAKMFQWLEERDDQLGASCS